MGVQKQALQGQKKKRLQWHPAFYAGIQIELAADADKRADNIPGKRILSAQAGQTSDKREGL